MDESQTTLDDFVNKGREKATFWKDEVSDLLSNSEFDFASDTLLGIYDFIEERGFVTDGQIQAIKNISKRDYGDA